MQRLERDFHTQYEFVGNFLVNPIITFVIQPTRGFGDFDMFGTRYGHRLQNTKTCKIEANRLVFYVSNSLFDTHVWADSERVLVCIST